MIKFIIYGGSFDPPHKGHVWAVKHLEAQGYNVLVVPCYSAENWGKKLTENLHRYNMCLEAFAETSAIVSMIDLQNHFEYTYETLDFVKERYPYDLIHLAIGEDWDIRNFKKSQYIKKNFPIVQWSRRFDISSTKIREQIILGKPTGDALTPEVKAYIKKHKLYSKTAEGRLLKADCSNYDSTVYQKPVVTVDVAICTVIDGDLKILLVKRRFPPDKKTWALVGGHVDVNKQETLEETAYRELKEEANLDNIYLEQLFTYGNPKRDPRDRYITVAYFALVPYEELLKQDLHADDDVEDAKWFSFKELDTFKLALDHRVIIDDVLKRLQGKIGYSTLAFQLLPKQFTIGEVQRVFEIILDKKQDPRNFKRWVTTVFNFKEVGFKNVKGRAAQLYVNG